MGLGDRFKKIFGQGKKENKNDNHAEEFKREFEMPKTELSSDDILFVCSSNTIISPMAKAIFNGKETDKKAFSAGIMASEGSKPAANVIEVCLNHGIDLRTFESTSITNFKLNESCLALTSSVSVRDFLKDVYPDYQIFTINEYAGFSNLDIEDPFGSDLGAFEECFCEIEKAIDEIIGMDKKSSDEEHTDFCDEIVKEIPIKDSSYISSLIDGGSKFIELDCDINGHFNIGVDDLVIEGNGRTVDLARNRCIITGNNITIKNLTFKNGFGDGYNEEGGAIFNKGSLTLVNCNFIDNHVKEVQAGAIANFGSLTCTDCEFHNNTSRGDCYTKGGAIWNKGSLTLKKCILKNNAAEKCGGAIHNEDGLLNLENCTFENNAVNDGFFVVGNGGAISNLGKINCFKSTFSGNESNNGSSIFNCDELTIVNSTLSGTGSNSNIHQINEDSVINIENSVLYGKTFIENGLCTVKRSDFNRFSIHNEKGTLKIPLKEGDKDPNIDSIYNNGILKILENSGIEDIVDAGENSVIEYVEDELDSDWKGFDYLNALIESGDCELSLDCDIALHESEQNFYEGGIEISKDNFTIDGNGHVIDASGMSRIFYITAKEVTLKNIVFKNGKYFKSFFDDETNGGGAIFVCHDSSLKVECCEFIDNVSKKSAGVINSKGVSLDILKSTFDNNFSENDGGCIFSISDMTIDGCIFKNNTSSKYHGGVISSTNRLTLSDSSFSNNKGYDGGVIYDRGLISLENCIFTNNYAQHGGVINAGEISKIDNCTFKDNSSHFNGGVIFSQSISLLKNSIFESNSGSEGGAIYNMSQLNIEKCIFKSNYCEHSPGGAIHNSGSLNVDGCDFENNSSKFGGGAILTRSIGDGTQSNITNCNFRNNVSDEGSALYLSDDNLNMKNCCFMGNGNNAVCNYGFVNLSDCQFEVTQNIFNHRTLKIPYSQRNSLLDHIENQGDISIDFDEEVIDKPDFYYLYNMIESSKSLTIKLENNFIFDGVESKSALPLRKDGLTIDGNGHYVVSSGRNVFKIMGDGVTLKNIKFVSSNPILQDGDGALNIEDCIFEDCRVSELNRASFADCSFNNAHIENDSGILNFSECAFDGCDWFNKGNVNLNKCNFSQSIDKSIFNEGTYFIMHCTYQDFPQITNRGEIFILDSERELADYVAGNKVKVMLDREDRNNFSHLTYLVHEFDEIALSEDIVFDRNYDNFEYVIIDRNGLVIDGRGHRIDASDCEGIFRIIGFNVTLKNIVFLNAKKSAIVNNSNLKVIDCDFKNNISDYNGGAIRNSGNLTVVNCYFENNRSTWKYAAGGAINNEKLAFISGCVFDSNHSESGGGAIYSSGALQLEGCAFKQNKSKVGGAIRSFGGRTHLTECLFENNSASVGGGIELYSGGEFSLTSSRFQSNFSDMGGCIYIDTGYKMAKISECSFNDNFAVRGGVVFNEERARLTIEKSTFESNRADNEGGVIYGGRLKVSSSRFCENISGSYGNAVYNTHDSAFRFCEFSSTQDSAFIFNSACLLLESCDFKSPGSDIIINTNNLKIKKTGFEKHHKIV